MNMKLDYCIDIDGVLCENDHHSNHENPTPRIAQINHVKRLQENHRVGFYTSRPNTAYRQTVTWLQRQGLDTSNGVFFDKPDSNFYIDDKMIPVVPSTGANLNRKKLVICWSGGMDSFIAYHYAIEELGYAPEDIMCLNFDIGHNYSEKEKRAREEIGIPFKTIPIGLINPELFDNAVDKDNYIIPARNLIFATIASSFGERVWIVGVKFENHYQMYDKNEAFFRTASLACSQATGAPTIVESPFIDWTKTQMIEWAISKGLIEGLRKTVSCYHDTHKRCGNCGLCWKRAIAMYMAGGEEVLPELQEYVVYPFTSETAKDFLRKYKDALERQDFSHYSKERIDEVWECYRWLGINIDYLLEGYYDKDNS